MTEEMLNKYKNQLAEIIASQQLHPTLFDIEHTKEYEYSVIKANLKDSPLTFTIKESDTNSHLFQCYYVTMTHSFYVKDPFENSPKYADFDYIQRQFTQWLNEHVKLYIEDQQTPDFWEIQKKMQSILNGIPQDENMYLPFTEPEQKSIQQGLAQLPKQIQKQLSLSDSEMAVVEEKTTYLSEALTRVNQFDWNNIALSTLISITIALSLDTEKGRLLFKLFSEIVKKALELLP